MFWYDLLKKVSIIGTICSIIITVIGFILFWLELKNPKNSQKLVEETLLEKYINVTLIGMILTFVFGIIIIIPRLFNI